MPASVLVVDFDRCSAETTAGDLAAAGVGVEIVTGPAELTAVLDGTSAAIVIVEPVLAGFDGFDVVRRFKNPASGPAPQVFSASRLLRGARYKATARDAGADLVLERPQDDPLLLIAVGKLLAPSGSVRQTAAVRAAAAHGAGSKAAPVALADPELDTLVDQMFDACFDPASEAAVAQDTALARTMRGRLGGMDAGTADLLASLEEIENSMPVAVATPAVDPAEIETSVPLAPPPRAREDVALDEMLDRITVGEPARPAAPAPAARAAVPAAPQVETAVPVATTETAMEDVPVPAARKSSLPMIAAACAALAAVAAGAWYFMRPGATETATAAAATQAASDPASDTSPGTPPVENATAPDGGVDLVVDTSGAATQLPPSAPPAVARTSSSAPGSRAVPPPSRDAASSTPAATGPVVPAGVATDPTPAGTAAVALSEPAPQVPEPVAQEQPPPSQPAAVPAAVSDDAPGQAPGTPDPEPSPRAAETAPASAQAPIQEATLDGQPELIASSRVAPVYPPAARRLAISATVTLAVTVRADGSVAATSVQNESVARLGFAEAARAAVAKWRFRPGTRDGQPVESQTRVTVRFAAR